MTTSGTTTFQNDFDLLEIVEEAYEMVGIEVRTGYDLKTARRSLDLLMREWGNRGINFWTIKETSANFAATVNTAVLDSDTIDILDASWRTGTGLAQNDRVMTRMSVKEWSEISNKNQPGMPSRFWVNRISPPVVTVWPVPTDPGTLMYFKLRRIEDAGVYTNTMDVPPRFLPAMTTGLAYYLALKTPAAFNRVPMLQTEYERQFGMASEEDRERASLFLVPDVGR